MKGSAEWKHNYLSAADSNCTFTLYVTLEQKNEDHEDKFFFNYETEILNMKLIGIKINKIIFHSKPDKKQHAEK